MDEASDKLDTVGDSVKDTPNNIRILNEKLGITSRENLFNSSGVKSINELFESSKRDFEKLCSDIASAKNDANIAESDVNSKFESFKRISKSGEAGSSEKMELMESAAASIANLSNTIKSMTSIVERGDEIIGKLYDAIVENNVLDPDLLCATATIIHSIRESNDNLIQFNLQKMQMEHQYRLAIEGEMLKQKHKLELEFFKHKLKIMEAEEKSRIKREEDSGKNVEVNISDGSNKREWNQSSIAEMIRNSSQTV